MRVLFFHRWVGIHTGGTENHIKGLVKGFAKRGHDVHILTTEGKELQGYEPPIKVWRISKSWMESDFSYPFQDIRCHVYTLLFVIKAFLKLLILKLKGVNYDVVSVHFFSEAFLMRFVKRIFGWPYVFVLEGNVKINMFNQNFFIEMMEARHSDLQIAITKGMVNDCYVKYGYKPLYLPHGIDSKQFNVSINGGEVGKNYAKNGEKLVLTVCRLEPRKDLTTLVSAAKIVCEKNPKIKFIIIGEGPEKDKIQRYIEELDLSDKVKLCGYVSDEELPKYYRACDLFVLPTLAEWLGMVFQEAMSSGLPIIATADEESLGECEIVVSPKRPNLLAEKILEVLDDGNLRARMINCGLNKAKEWDWEALIPEYVKAYQSVVKT